MVHAKDPFESSKYHIYRAKKHADDFKRQSALYVKSHPHAFVIDIENGQFVHKIRIVKPIPKDLRGLAFDTAVALRSSLDGAIFSMLGQEFAKFPFSKDASHFSAAIKGKCKGLPVEMLDLISAFKPYGGGNDLLWALNHMCNAGKHGIIHPVGITSDGMWFHGAKGIGIISFGGPGWDRTKNEMEIARTVIGGAIQQEISFSLLIELGGTPIVAGKEASAVLDELIRQIEAILMAIEAEALRLKLV